MSVMTTNSSKVETNLINNVMVAGSRRVYDLYNTVSEEVVNEDGEVVKETRELTNTEKQAIVARAMYAATIDRANIDTLIHGANENSPDEWGKTWASMRSDVEEDPHKAEWNNIDHPNAVVEEGKYGKYDKSAGFRRNSEMVERADALIAFWDGESPGTKDSIDKAREAGIPVTVIRFDRKSERKAILQNITSSE